jgi:Domain of unknown function (DUF5666)
MYTKTSDYTIIVKVHCLILYCSTHQSNRTKVNCMRSILGNRIGIAIVGTAIVAALGALIMVLSAPSAATPNQQSTTIPPTATSPNGPVVFLIGTITEVNTVAGDRFKITNNGQTVTVFVNDATQYIGVTSLPKLRIGQRVQLKGHIQSATVFQALSVEIL